MKNCVNYKNDTKKSKNKSSAAIYNNEWKCLQKERRLVSKTKSYNADGSAKENLEFMYAITNSVFSVLFLFQFVSNFHYVSIKELTSSF